MKRDTQQLVFRVIDELEQVLSRSGLSPDGKRRAAGVLLAHCERLQRRKPAQSAPAPAQLVSVGANALRAADWPGKKAAR